jgi:hypothetical protein
MRRPPGPLRCVEGATSQLVKNRVTALRLGQEEPSVSGHHGGNVAVGQYGIVLPPRMRFGKRVARSPAFLARSPLRLCRFRWIWIDRFRSSLGWSGLGRATPHWRLG